MTLAHLLSLPIAFALGSALAGLAGLLESLAFHGALPTEALAAYALLGGALGVAARLVLGRYFRTGGALSAALAVIAPFASLYLIYFVNVRLLPGDPYWSFKSLSLDALAFAVTVAPILWIARSAWAREARERWGKEAAAVGSALLVACLSVVAAHRPTSADDPVRRGEGPNLVLIVLDSARRDHVGLYGYKRPTSAAIDAVEKSARVYDAAYAASSWTVPSVHELLRATATGSGDRGPSLPKHLVARGYVAACFTDNPHMGRGSDLTQGFDRVERSVSPWRRLLRGSVIGEVIERLDPGDDERLSRRAMAWAQRTRGPFFLYVHLMDSHTPYRYPALDGAKRRGRRIEFPVTGMRMTSEEADDVVARYDAGIRSADAQVGRLLTAARGWGRPFVAIVTSDHGESLGESGRWFHGGSLAPELLAIPLLVIGEGVDVGRVSVPVGHAAIPQTLLAAADIFASSGSSADLRNRDGSGVVNGELPPDLAYRIAGGFKVVVDRTGHRHLFDLRRDPEELSNLAHEKPDLAEALATGLITSRAASTPPAEVQERLRALGYVESAR